MIGFEIEIDLAVTDAHGGRIAGDTDLARSAVAPPAFKLVSDSRDLNHGGKYSNLEFVTDAVSAIGLAHAAGSATILAQLAEVQRVRNALYVAAPGPLNGADPQLNTLPGAGATARVDDTLNYNETNTLLVHYSVGVPLAGMPRFFDRVRAAAPVLALQPGDHPSLIRDRFNLHQARAFAVAEVARFSAIPGNPAVGSQQARALNGYLQLAYMQICALADHLDYNGQGGMIKNLTADLCRSAFMDIVGALSPQARNYLVAGCAGTEPLITRLAAFQEVPEPGFPQNHAFHEDGVRTSGNLAPITLINFTKSVLTGATRVDPERVFGGMREIPAHPEQGVTVVPMELRSIGNEAKTWVDVQNELGHLCNWAQEAFGLA
jgi:hypothetical protein